MSDAEEWERVMRKQEMEREWIRNEVDGWFEEEDEVVEEKEEEEDDDDDYYYYFEEEEGGYDFYEEGENRRGRALKPYFIF